MAEVVGVISGAITIGALATNVAMSVTKLKSYWNQLEDAPEDVRRLIDEIEILSLILNDIKDDQARNAISSLLLDGTSQSRCLEHCQKAVDRLRRLTDDMGISINTSHKLQRNWASAKVLLKKEKIEKFKLEVEGAARLLSLSHQIHTRYFQRALLRLQPDIIFAQVRQAMATAPTSTHITIESHQHSPLLSTLPPQAMKTKRYLSRKYSHQRYWKFSSAFNVLGSFTCRTRNYAENNDREMVEYGNAHECQEIITCYQSPLWLVNRAWNLHAKRSCHGWDFSIRQYNFVPKNSLVFEYARLGNIPGLRELLDRCEASPFDYNEHGWTPLHFAASYGRHHVCKLLIDLGADASLQIVGHCSPIELALVNAAFLCFPYNNQDALETSRLLLSKADINPHELGRYRGPEECFALWRQYVIPHYYDTDLQERVEMGIELACSAPINGPMLLKKALGLDNMSCLAGSLKDSIGKTLLHALGKSIGEVTKGIAQNRYSQLDPQKYEDDLAGWRSILRELVYAGADLHAITSERYTPFIYLLMSTLEIDCDGVTYPWRSILDVWLSELAGCGVDLHIYGGREEELRDKGLTNWECWYIGRHFKSDGNIIDTSGRLVALSYGRSPSDWHVVVEQLVKPHEDLEQIREIPGGWIDE